MIDTYDTDTDTVVATDPIRSPGSTIPVLTKLGGFSASTNAHIICVMICCDMSPNYPSYVVTLVIYLPLVFYRRNKDNIISCGVINSILDLSIQCFIINNP